jgi:hypothetical protein
MQPELFSSCQCLLAINCFLGLAPRCMHIGIIDVLQSVKDRATVFYVTPYRAQDARLQMIFHPQRTDRGTPQRQMCIPAELCYWSCQHCRSSNLKWILFAWFTLLVIICCTLLCRFFPATHYLSTSKVAIAALSNFAFAMMLVLYNRVTKVCRPPPSLQL